MTKFQPIKATVGRVKKAAFQKQAIPIILAAVVVLGLGGLALANPPAPAKKHPAKATKHSKAVADKSGKVTSPKGKNSAKASPHSSVSPTDAKAARAQRNAKRLDTMIDSAIKQKRLTANQKKTIEDEKKSLADFNTSLAKLAPADRAKAKVEKMGELYTWAKNNKIPYSIVTALSRASES